MTEEIIRIMQQLSEQDQAEIAQVARRFPTDIIPQNTKFCQAKSNHEKRLALFSVPILSQKQPCRSSALGRAGGKAP